MTFKRQLRFVTVILLCFVCTVDSAFAAFSVDFTDVGAGDCILVQCDNRVMMIDTGPGRAWNKVDKELTDRRVNRIDLLVLTHSHPDHTANLDRILSSRLVSRVLWSDDDSESFTDWKTVLEDSGIPCGTLKRGDNFELGEASCHILWPAGEMSELFNDRSVVMKITYHGFCMLLMGDAESETERKLLSLSAPEELEADLIKLGHHGMSTSSTWPLISAVSPTYAIASCAGPDQNSSLSPLVSETLEECGVTVVLTTAEFGTVHLEIDDSNRLTIR